MIGEISSRYFVQRGSTSGKPVVEQIYPPLPSGLLEGEKAAAILRLPERVQAGLRSYYEDRAEPNGDTHRVFLGDCVEVRLGEKMLELAGWEITEQGESFVNMVEAGLGMSGLTIVLERGILQRPVH